MTRRLTAAALACVGLTAALLPAAAQATDSGTGGGRGAGGPGKDGVTSRQLGSAQATEGSLAGITGGASDRAWVASGSRSRSVRGAARAIKAGPLARGKRPHGVMPDEPYLPQAGCYPHELPGLRAFRAMLLATFPRPASSLLNYNVVRGCNTPGISEHEEGRALDFEAHVSDTRQNAQARTLLRWLTRAHGYQAKRLGILYIIYDQHIWGQYNQRWRWMEDRGSVTDNHMDHMHFTFTWNGALRLSAYWTGRVPGIDYGPCPAYEWSYAPVLVHRLRRHPRHQPCPAPRPIPRSWHYRSSIMYWESGAPVSWLQQYLHEAGVFAGNPTGEFGPITYAAVRQWQKRHHVPRTGVWDPATQNASGVVVGRRARTWVQGWDARPTTARAHSVLKDLTVVHSGRQLRDRVVIVNRRRAGRPWRPVWFGRTGSDGTITLRLPLRAGRWQFKARVIQSSFGKPRTTRIRTVTTH